MIVKPKTHPDRNTNKILHFRLEGSLHIVNDFFVFTAKYTKTNLFYLFYLFINYLTSSYSFFEHSLYIYGIHH